MFIRCKTIWRVLPVFQHSVYSSTSAVGINPAIPAAAAESSTDNSVAKATEIPTKESTVSEVPKKPTESKKKLVSAAFSSLKEIDSPVYKELESKIYSAETVDSLLDVSEMKGISRSHSFKIVSKLADWTTDGKVKLIDFETDPRFTKLCSSLGHNIATKPFNKKSSKGEPVVESFSDLGVVLGVAGDDEAAKLVNTITVPQMIKVLSSLAYKKRRSMPLLRSLAFNIGKSSDEINIKDCADILYACGQLSFQDEVLFEKVCSDICKCVKDNKKPAVIGSIVTSLGFIRYKDSELLDLVCDWVMQNFSICRIQDLVTLVLTLATVSHIPANGDVLFEKLKTHLQQSDVPTPNAWLDVVWALAVLNKATANHVSSVLTEEFLKRLATSQIDGSISTISKLKLLNINGAAKLLIENYNGPFLDLELDNLKVEVPRAKEKLNLITTVLDTLTNLLPSSVYMQTNVNTDMGYIIDGECCVDSSLTPLPLIDKKTLKPIDRSQPGIRKGIKIAILVLDYHDITKGQKDPVGIANLAIQLSQKSGYKVITIPYYDFNPRDKLVTRVQYLEEQLKNVVQNSSSS